MARRKKQAERLALDAGFTSAAIDREAVRRGGLAEFVALAWPYVDPAKHVSERHEKEICKHLEAVASGDIKRLLINLPPGLSKSLLACVFWPAWVWTFAPSTKWGFASYDQPLVLRDARRCRALIESSWYQERWPLKLVDDSNRMGEYTNEHMGYRLSVTIRGGLTGKHVDIAVIDDPHKPMAFEVGEGTQESRAVRDWYDGTLTSRFTDQAKARKVIIMQRLSDLDLSQHVLDGTEGYQHLCLPMEFDPTRRSITTVGGDWRTLPGELLAPKRFPAEAIAAMKGAFRSERVASAQLQQDPMPADGSIFKDAWFQKRYDSLPTKHMQIFHSWDCAFKDSETSDFVVGQVWGVVGDDYYLLDQVRGKWDFVDTCAQIQALISRYPKYMALLIEDKANGSAIVSYLKSRLQRMIAINPEGGKASRAAAVSPLFESGHIHLPASADWLGGYLKEMLAFPASKHDDQVDATTQVLNYLTASNTNTTIKALEKIKRGFLVL